MATTTNYSSLKVVYSPQVAANTKHSLDPFLELSLAQTTSQGAYLYRLDEGCASLHLAGWSGRAASEIDDFDVELRPEAARWHRENRNAVLLHPGAWFDWRLERFPEFLRNRFESAASIPLVEGGRVVGLLNVARVAPSAFQPHEAAFLRSLGLPLGSLLADSAARVKLESEVEQLSRQLADRKLLDRAKGVLQAAHRWTEEESYLYLRRASRQRRTPMRLIAREVVDESLRSAQ